MHIKRLHELEEALSCLLETQLGNLEDADAAEMGEVVDMIKDIEEAKYYCSVVKAMEEASEYNYSYDPMNEHRMYYHDSKIHHTSKENETYSEREFPYAFQDSREGRSHRSRRMYMEAKETHQEKSVQMRELEKYMQELAQDIIEMIEDATSEEKLYLSKKITALANKVQNLND